MSIYVKDHDDNCQKLCNTSRFPDFFQFKTLSWSRESNHIFEKDCYVCVCNARSNSYGYGCELKINSTMLIHMTSNNTETWQSICIPASAGDVLSCNKYFAGDIQIIDLK